MFLLKPSVMLSIHLVCISSIAQPMMADDATKADVKSIKPNGTVADPAVVGGESGSVIKVANLVYAGTKTSECFQITSCDEPRSPPPLVLVVDCIL